MGAPTEEVRVDRERCVGAAQCVLAAPAAFDQSEEDGRVLPLPGTDGRLAVTDAVRTAVRLCPSGALFLVGSR